MYTEIIGATGASLILITFILNQLHIWKDTDLRYDMINTLGSLLLIIYAVLLQSYPFLILNTIWMLVSLRDVIVTLKHALKK